MKAATAATLPPPILARSMRREQMSSSPMHMSLVCCTNSRGGKKFGDVFQKPRIGLSHLYDGPSLQVHVRKCTLGGHSGSGGPPILWATGLVGRS
jgi:hypothetical protein